MVDMRSFYRPRARKPTWRRRNYGGAARTKLAYRKGRRTAMSTPMFTETYAGTPIVYNATTPGQSLGLISNKLSDIPQIADYTNLYNQYCIKRITAIFIPAYNVFDQPGALAASAVAAPRFVYSVQDTALVVPPTTEAQVLSDNKAKIKMFTKPVRVSWVPRAQAADALTSGGFVAVNRSNAWYNTAVGANVLHNGLQYAFTNDVALSGNPVLAQVYFKVTFALRDPI